MPAYCTVDQVAMVLWRGPAPPADVDALTLAVATACELIAQRIDDHPPPAGAGPATHPLVPPYPAPIVRAAIGASIRVFRFKDTESDVAEAWGDLGAPIRTPRDPLAGYRDLLAPYVHDWPFG